MNNKSEFKINVTKMRLCASILIKKRGTFSDMTYFPIQKLT